MTHQLHTPRNHRQGTKPTAATTPALKPKQKPQASGSRGVVATADIPAGEPLLELPHHLLLTPAAALDAPPPLGQALEDCAGDMADEELLAVLLMHELGQGRASFYHPYLAILPPKGDLSCLVWTEAELRECQDPWLLAEVTRRRKEMVDRYDHVVRGLLQTRHPAVFGAGGREEAEDGGLWSFEQFEYAMLLVQV
jgi:hypothetical protein